MEERYSKAERKGLPGGPNEVFTYVTGIFSSEVMPMAQDGRELSNPFRSTQGYKRNSPDVNNPFNIIPSGRITMKDVDFPVTGIDNLGNQIMMMPDEEYQFAGDEVIEIPHLDMHKEDYSHMNAYAKPIMESDRAGIEGGFHSKHLDAHGSFVKPLQKIAGMSDSHFSLTGKFQKGQNEFSIRPEVSIHHGNPEFGINFGFKRSFQDGGDVVISDRPDDSYEYKKSVNPDTGKISYATRKKGSNTWRDAGSEGSTSYRAITDIFGDDKTGYATSPEKARFNLSEKKKRKMQDYDYIQSLMNKDGAHVLDLVYGNEELGIPAFGPEIQKMDMYAEDFFDPYGDLQDEYMLNRVGGTEEEREQAAKNMRANYLNNVGRTEEEDQAYEAEMQRLREEEDKKTRKEREAERLELGYDPYTGNVVAPWEGTGMTADEYYEDFHDSGIQDILDYTGASTVMELTGMAPGARLAYKVNDEGVGKIVGDVANTGADLVGIVGEGIYEGGDYLFGDGSFDIGERNPLTGNIYGSGLETTSDLLSIIPYVGLAGKSAGLAGKANRIKNVLGAPGKALKTGVQSKVAPVFNKSVDALGSVKLPGFNYMGNMAPTVGDVGNFVNKNVMKKQLVPSYLKNTKAAQNAKKLGLSGDVWGGLTGYGIYGAAVGDNDASTLFSSEFDPTKSALGRLSVNALDDLNLINESRKTAAINQTIDQGYDPVDVVKAGINIVPGGMTAKEIGTALYPTKAGLKFIDKSGSVDKKEGGAIYPPANPLRSKNWNMQYAQDGGETEDNAFVGDFMYTVDDIKHMNDNPEQFCAEGDCLAQAFDVYDKRIGKRYSSSQFPSENRLKSNLGISSGNTPSMDTPGYKLNKDGEVVVGTLFEDDEGRPVTEREKRWIEKNPYFYQTNDTYGKELDMSADSWDIHGIMVDKGGKNLFTGSVGDFDNLSEDKKSNILKSMPIGTIIGFGEEDRHGYNKSKGLASSKHSAIVVGYTQEGDPVVYDYGEYTTITPDSYGTAKHGYSLADLNNITYPKDQEGKTKKYLEEEGLFNNDPKKLDLNQSALQTELYDKGDSKELKAFHDTLVSKKRSLMNALDMNESDYNMISALLLAQTMQESSGGKSFEDKYIPNFVSEWQGDTQGLTQLNINNILDDEALAPIAKKYGITEEADLFDPVKSAIASMIYGKRNLAAAKKNYKDGKESGVRTYKPRSDIRETLGMNVNITYNGDEFKTDEGVVVPFESSWGFDYDIDEIQAKFDEITDKDGNSVKGKYKVYEKDGEILVDKNNKG